MSTKAFVNWGICIGFAVVWLMLHHPEVSAVFVAASFVINGLSKKEN
jgi:hypothetical protein